MEAVREMTRQELIDENNRLRSELNNVQAVDGLYQDMCSNIHALVTAIYGDGYYNTGMDAWTHGRAIICAARILQRSVDLLTKY